MRVGAAIVVGETGLRNALYGMVAQRGFDVLEAEAFDRAEVALIECDADPGDSGILCLKRIRDHSQKAKLIILARTSSEELAISALRLNAAEYLPQPYDLERVATLLDQWSVKESDACDEIVGESPAMKKVKSFIGDLARTESSVLITGPTGTGKELVAEHIHGLSARRDKPFVCLNCAAIPDTLLESELFGYEKGAFTGATSARDGKLAQANGGTVFFDEIGDLSQLAQAKILRAIETKEFYRLGGSRRQAVDIRVIAATNRDLDAMVKEDRFRADLYYRLNVGRIRLPALRERRSDIFLLIQHFLPRFNRIFRRRVTRFDGDALNVLSSYSWPGNVRELRNTLEVTYLNLKSDTVTLQDLPDEIRGTPDDAPGERERLMAALLDTEWNVSRAARKLRWSRMTMYRRMAKHNVSASKPPKAFEAASG